MAAEISVPPLSLAVRLTIHLGGPQLLQSVRTELFCVLTQRPVVISYRRFVTNPLKMRPIGCARTSVRNYHYSLRNIPEERCSQLLRDGSLKSRIVRSVWRASVICSCGKRRCGQIHAPAILTTLQFGQNPTACVKLKSKRNLAQSIYCVAGLVLLLSLEIQQTCRL